MALPGFLWLGEVSLGACQKHVHVHPSLQDAAQHKTQRKTHYTNPHGFFVNLRATCNLSRAKGVYKDFNLPLGGVFGSAQSSSCLRFGQNTAYSALRRLSICTGRNDGREDETTQTRSANT